MSKNKSKTSFIVSLCFLISALLFIRINYMYREHESRLSALENKNLMTEDLYMEFHQGMLEFNQFWENEQDLYFPLYQGMNAKPEDIGPTFQGESINPIEVKK